MEIKITRFENGEILIRDTEKMKTVENKIVEVVVREYPTTKENLIGILGQVEKLEQEAIAKKQEVVEAKIEDKNEVIVEKTEEQNQTETNNTEEIKE